MNRLLQRLLSMFRRESLDADLDAELASHLELAAADLEREGHSPAEAQRIARVRLGGIEASKDSHRDSRGFPWLDSLLQDARHALRGFARAPGFTAVATAIMAIGIGANTAVFTVVSPLLLKPLPFQDPERLVWMERSPTQGGGLSSRTMQVAMFEDLRRGNRSFEDVTAYFPFVDFGAYKLTGRGDPERVHASELATNFFQTLGVKPLLGRDFQEADGKLNAPQTAILSYGYWQRRFNGDASIVGQSLNINDETYQVAGVMGPDFDFSSIFSPASPTDLFVPARMDRMRRWGNVFFLIGRMKPGVTLGQARGELTALVPQLMETNKAIFPSKNPLVATELAEHVGGNLRRPLIVLWCAVGLVLLVVCANLSNLMLARTGARAKELAVRTALGAGRIRLARQLVTEGVLLASLGALLGLPLAFGATRALQSAASLSIPMLYQMRLDTQAIGFAMLLALITGAIIGLAPTLRLPSGTTMSNDLRDSSRSATGGRGQQWIRSALVVAEVAMAFVLLAGAGLLLRSFVRLLDVDMGFDASRAVVVPIDLPQEKTCPSEAECFWRSKARLDEVVRRAAAIPGVEAAALTDALPLGRNRSWGLQEKGKQYPPGTDNTSFVYLVSADFFKAMGIPLISGHGFSEEDAKATEGLTKVVINQTAARTLWPGQDATGKIASIGRVDAQIVGVAADTRQSSLDTGPGFQMYLPQGARFGLANDLVVRSKLPAATMAASIRTAVAAYNPELVTNAFRPVQDLVDVSVSPRRFVLGMIAVFAAIALILAALGIYGVISYSVGQRIREMGIRVALGANPSDLRWSVVGGTAALALCGIALGALAGLAAGRFVASMLYQTSPLDPVAFGLTAGLLFGVAVLSGYVPALRASRVDPAIALRSE